MAKDRDVGTNVRIGDAGLAGRRHIALASRLVLPLAAILFAVLSVLRFGSHVNADALLPSIASIQHPRLFYWGQNRFLSLVPFALSWEKDPFANLLVSSFIYALSFYLLLWQVMRFVANEVIHRGELMDQALCFLILCGVFLAGSTSEYFYQFAVDPSQPYALSYLLLVTAALLIFFGSSYPALSLLGSGAAAFLATGVNFSVIAAAGAMFLAAAWFLNLHKACLFFGLCAASFAFWYWVSQYYEAPRVSYYALGFRGPLGNLSASLHNIAASVRPVPVALLIAMLLATTILVRGERLRPLEIFTGALVAFGLVWWMVISQNAWTQANHMNVRYFFPTLLCLGVAVAVALWARAVVAPRGAKLALIALLSIAILGILVRPIQSISTYPVLAKVGDAVAFARVHGIRYVSGEYWEAWPAVFLLLDRPDAAFGMTNRGEAILSTLRQAVERDAQSGSPVNALCLNATVTECQRLLRWLSGREWELSPLACTGICSVLTLAPQGAHSDATPN